MNFRWLFNLVIFVPPTVLIGLVALWWNSHVNRGLEEMNSSMLYKMEFNELFLAYQVFNSIFVVADLPVYLRHFKRTRVYSFVLAVIWNTIYFLFMWSKVSLTIFKPSHYSEEVYTDLLMESYGNFLHWPTLLVNFAIVIKELNLYFYSFWSGLTVGDGELFFLRPLEIENDWITLITAPLSLVMG